MKVYDETISNEEFTTQSKAMMKNKRQRKANIYPVLYKCSTRIDPEKSKYTEVNLPGRKAMDTRISKE